MHLHSTFSYVDGAQLKLHANRDLVGLWKLVLSVSLQKGGLADTGVADEEELEEVVTAVGRSGGLRRYASLDQIRGETHYSRASIQRAVRVVEICHSGCDLGRAVATTQRASGASLAQNARHGRFVCTCPPQRLMAEGGDIDQEDLLRIGIAAMTKQLDRYAE